MARDVPCSHAPQSVCDLIEQHACFRPHEAAVRFQNKSLSYANLSLASSRIALLLQSRGVSKNERVPVLTYRCLEMVVCFLGVLKTGACYVPIDIDAWSEDRIQSTLSMISSNTIITTGTTRYDGYNPITLQDVRNAIQPEEIRYDTPPSTEFVRQSVFPSDLAYIIFTSGVTSAPKGVMVPHRALLNYVQQGGERTPFNMNVKHTDRVLLVFSIAFDACSGVVFSTLCNSGTLVISDTSDLIQCAKICNKIPATPSILGTFTQPQSLGNVVEIYLGGESPSRHLIQQWQSSTRRIFNAYGPTETTCASTIAELRLDTPIVLGSTMPGSQIVLLNEDLQMCREGEICISGPGLAVGYFKNEALTKQKFIDWRGIRIYRTGDFGRRTKHGIEFIGRRDSVVKNRGFLVNLESQVIPALQAYPGVTSATAFMHQGKLIAYIVPAALDSNGIRLQLSLKLDSYLIPDQIRTLEAMPLSANGKVDNHILKRGLETEMHLGTPIQPKTCSKPEILKIGISEALLLPLEEISDDQSFWSLGGNSLSALKLLSYLYTQQLSLPLSQIFQLPDLKTMAENLSVESPTSFAKDSLSRCWLKDRGTPCHCSTQTVPMTTLQMQMARSLLKNPLLNYMIISITFEYHDVHLLGHRLEHAWRTVLNRHSIFRMVFDVSRGLQQARDDLDFDWQTITTEPEEWEATCEKAFRDFHDQIQHMTLDNVVRPLISFRLVILPHQKSSLFWLVHHSQIDGWSTSVIIKELQAVLDGRDLTTAPQFSDVVFAQERQRKKVEREGEVFWTQILDQHLPPPALTLLKAKTVDSLGQPREEHIATCIPLPQLEQSARLYQVSSAAIFYTAWATLISRYCSSNRITFGVVLSGRNIPMPFADRVVGPLLNTCPFPVHLRTDWSKADMLSSVYNRLCKMHDFQWSAYQVTERLATGSHAELLSTTVAIEYDLPGYQWECETLPGPWKFERQDNPEFALSLKIGIENDKIVLRLQYNSSQHESAAIKRLLCHFQNILDAVLDPNCSTMEIVHERMTDRLEMRSLIRHPSPRLPEDAYEGPVSLKDAVEAAADQWPHLVAVESTNVSMTYQQLDEASTSIADHLVNLVKPGEIVGILSDGSLQWILGIVSVIKAGAVCAPIDVQLPLLRVRTIIEDAKIRFCLVPTRRYEQDFPLQLLNVLIVDEFLKADPPRALRPQTVQRAENAAYIVFTSGSTGIPKGVRVSHIGILSLLTHPPARLHSGPGRRIAQTFSVGFDGCTAEIFGSLIYGATLVLKDPTDPFAHLHCVDAVMATPSLVATLPVSDLQNLETVVFLGEPLPQGLADAWAGGRRLYNAYGPCECAFLSTIAPLPPGKRVTLGYPVPGMNVRLLDAKRRLVPVGIKGEIYLSGIQVSPGYLGLEEENKARFMQDPFMPEVKMYRTGDLGMWTESMELQFIGRIDNQVKLRGFRIELEEIDRVILSTNAAIRQAAAIVRDDSLFGFVAPQNVNVGEISKTLSSTLPFYAQPSQVIALPSIPLSPNQKVDRNAMEKYAVNRTKKGREPSTRTEMMVAKIWKELITSDNLQDLGTEDDFMLVGGNSLLQIRIAQKLSKELGTRIPLGIVIRNTTLSHLTKAIDEYIASGECQPSVSKLLYQRSLKPLTALPLSQLEEEMYFLHELSNCKSAYHMVCQLELEGLSESGYISEAINLVIAEHAMLRARYICSEGVISRHVSGDVLPAQQRRPDFTQHGFSDAEINRPFDLAKDQLIRAFLIQKEDKVISLLLVIHHIIADKQTLISVLQKIRHTYMKRLNAPPSRKRRIEDVIGDHDSAGHVYSYTDWVLQSKSLRVPDQVSNKMPFWQQHLHDLPSKPISERAGLVEQNNGLARSFFIGRFQSSSHSQRIAVAAVSLMTHIAFGASDMLIAMPYMDRLEPGTADMLGLFLDRVVMRIDFSVVDMTSAMSLLGTIESNLQDVLTNYIPYHRVCEAAGLSDLFDIMVTYHWQDDSFEKHFQIPGIWTSSRPARAKGAKFPIMYEFTETEQGLVCEIEYNTNLVSEGLVDVIQKTLPDLVDGLYRGRQPNKMISTFTQQNQPLPVTPLRHTSPLEPTSGDEQVIMVIRSAFAETLGLNLSKISWSSRFSDLGGSSIMFVRLRWLLRRRGLAVPLHCLVRGQTAEMIAAML